MLAAPLVVVIMLAGCGGRNTSTASGTDTTTSSASNTAATGTTDGTPPTTTITIRVVGGKPEGGIARPKVKRDAEVLLVVHSDTADEVHVHGYNLSRRVAS